MKILISGASGLIGTTLVEKLRKRGHFVNILVRKNPSSTNEFLWNPAKQSLDTKALEDIDSIIHLAGATISKRWTSNYKKEIIASRVESGKLLLDQAENLGIHLKSFITASGTNYYGTLTSEKIFQEEDPIQHRDFLSEVCEVWENAADKFSKISDRIVKIRTAPVFSKKGGALEQLVKITNLNLASGIGSGGQYFPWIHIDDLVDIYIHALENQNINGAINAVADEIPTNKELMRKLAEVRRKLFIPINVPSFLLKLTLGEMSEMLLEGSRVSNKKIKSLGFDFQYPDLDSALKDLL